MPPIRVGLIGLGPKPTIGFRLGLWSALAHLPSIEALPEYQLVAIANSTAESARKAIVTHGLPDTVKAYGSPEDLASDPDVDLVVVSVKVQKHFQLAKPAILQKKNVFVEWPLGASIEESEELTKLAKASGVKTLVGLQGHASKLSLKMAELVASGKIGRVLSTSVSIPSSMTFEDGWLHGDEYALDMKSGVNEYWVSFGHFLHSFVNVLGNFSDVQAVLKTQYTEIPLHGADNEVVNPAYRKTSPDDILIQGILKSGATASLNFFKSNALIAGDRSFIWRITGMEGEIELSAPEFGWQMGHPQSQILVKVGKSGEPQKVDLETPDTIISNLPPPAQNTAIVYGAFAKGDLDGYATFEQATQTHRILQRILDASGFKH